LLGLFLAILELIKQREVQAEQREPFGDIYVVPAPPAETNGAADYPATDSAAG
jgi:chromatin segregation and condensation protein Rec8/ScpA/Scc1 (kleisin family)